MMDVVAVDQDNDANNGNDVLIIHQRFQLAVKRVNCVLSRPSSVAAEEFLDNNWENDEAWKSLAQKLNQLAYRLQQKLLQDEVGHYFTNRVSFTAAVFSRVESSCFLGRKLTSSLRRLFAAALQARDKQWQLLHTSNMTLDDDGEEEGDVVDNIDFEKVFSSLRQLGWLPSSPMVHRALRMAMYDVNEQTIRKLICSQYEQYGMWEAVLEWKKSVLENWLFQTVLGISQGGDDDWQQKIDLLVATSFVQVRMEELFTIITEYPESKPAVEELREAITFSTTPVQKMRLAASLKENLQRRLLHPGANTAQILDVYISAIKVLRAIDANSNSNGQQQLLLETVAEPIKNYLRARNDTVRCIITGLTDEKSGGDLYEELRRQDATLLETGYESEDDEEPPNPNWKPMSTPQQQALAAVLISNSQVTSPLLEATASDKQQEDILAMLVGIYGSQELFVNEYRIMLADKLLANLEFDTDKEVHTLELLKLRFGETSLRQCEIMIKDIDDSKRIVTNIRSTTAAQKEGKNNELMIVDAAIVSHIFWPPLSNDVMTVHPKIQLQLDQFGKEYENLKNPRKLIWLSQLGTVQIELEVLDDNANVDEPRPRNRKKQEFSCSPLQATLITHFEDKDCWTAAELCNETGVSEDIIKRKMGYWLNQRILQCSDIFAGEDLHGGARLSTVKYTLCSLSSSGSNKIDQSGADDGFLENGAGSTIMMEDDEDEDDAIKAKSQEAAEMKVYESYIVGMLANLGQLPVDRIHNMLKMFVSGSDHKYDKTPQELSSFLKYLCKQDKLELTDGLYKLVSKR